PRRGCAGVQAGPRLLRRLTSEVRAHHINSARMRCAHTSLWGSMRSSRIHRIDRPPAVVGYSLVLGLAFVAVLMGFTAVRARDGRMPVTDWLDPLIAGVTLLAVLGALAALVVVWGHLPTRLRAAAAAVLIGAEWTYV